MIKIEIGTDRFILEQMESSDVSLIDSLIDVAQINHEDIPHLKRVLLMGRESIFLVRLDKESPPRALIVGCIKRTKISISCIRCHEALEDVMMEVFRLSGKDIHKVLRGY